MKAKNLAKRLRARSDEFRGMVELGQEGYTVLERAQLIAKVLLELADQIDLPPSKKAKKKENKRLKLAAKRAAKRAAKKAVKTAAKKVNQVAKKTAKQVEEIWGSSATG